MTRNKVAFTLVELLVAMSIIAVLIGLSVFGISTAQRNLRDNQRRDAVRNIAASITDYYTKNSSYPSTRSFSEFKSALKINTQGSTNAGTSTTSNQTLYCYAVTNDGYKLGAKLENGDWFNIGISTQTCGDSITLDYFTP